ncbi:MAG: pyridoxine 5'-phosphate synthase [Alphaproteobacteria bacterium]|nr:pyridoxine 5'-phosphate synthase [Alphaproteobacteria bacterium]
MKPIRLGVNIDHVATIRNARGGDYPDPLRAALLAQDTGADGITIHLREDRRHIIDGDVGRIKSAIRLPLNLEMAATDEMVAIALRTRPHAVCFVPERRQEITTEGGLNLSVLQEDLRTKIQCIKQAGIKVSLFIEPEIAHIKLAKELDADIVELHTGKYCSSTAEQQHTELEKIMRAAAFTQQVGLECHAGHGISYATVEPIAAIVDIVELNIGHFLIGEAIFVGLSESVRHMKMLINKARGI